MSVVVHIKGYFSRLEKKPTKQSFVKGIKNWYVIFPRSEQATSMKKSNSEMVTSVDETDTTVQVYWVNIQK